MAFNVTITNCSGGAALAGCTLGNGSCYTDNGNGTYTFSTCDHLSACAGNSGLTSSVNTNTIPSTGGTAVFTIKNFGLNGKTIAVDKSGSGASWNPNITSIPGSTCPSSTSTTLSVSTNITTSQKSFTVCPQNPNTSQPTSCSIVTQEPANMLDIPLTFEILTGGTIAFGAFWMDSDDELERTISYSRDNGQTWTDITVAASGESSDTKYINVEAGEILQFEAYNSYYYRDDNCYIGFHSGSAKFNVLGNIMSMIYGDMFRNQTSLTSGSAFRRFFYNVDGIVDASRLKLPATTLANYCYSHMFYNCTSLTSAPALPATTLATHCYNAMFDGCTSLTSAPALPATTLAAYCYSNMFEGCASLTTAPALPATTLAAYCYSNMFEGCASLTTAPALSATTLSNSCYQNMFYNCTGLTTAPALPATTLAPYCYQNMFYNCTGLTTAPALPATTLANSCYDGMFRGCTSLTSAPALSATTLASYCCQNMFSNCTSLTTAPSLSATTVADYCCYRMFYGCTSLTTAPALPATTLANYCYSYMFYNCTSLTTAPALPATTLANYCYSYMFNSCTSLTTVPALSATTLADYCCYRMFYNCTSLTTAPALPATTLAPYCYQYMFSYCASLTTAPALSATTLTAYCYRQMFRDCSQLSYIKCLATDISASNCTAGWTNGVASSGTFVKASTMNDWTRGVNGIPTNWTVQNDGPTTRTIIIEFPDEFSVEYQVSSCIGSDYNSQFDFEYDSATADVNLESGGQLVYSTTTFDGDSTEVLTIDVGVRYFEFTTTATTAFNIIISLSFDDSAGVLDMTRIEGNSDCFLGDISGNMGGTYQISIPVSPSDTEIEIQPCDGEVAFVHC